MEDDKHLLSLLKKGDRGAFDAIFKKYAPKLYFFSLKFFNSKDDADEIVQETFVRVWKTRGELDENQNFNAYLVTIAKNLIYNVFRRRLVEKKYVEYILLSSTDSYSIEHELVMRNLKERMLQGIEQLPPQQKEVLLLRNKGYSNDEIAKQLSLSKRTVEAHIGKAFKYLRSYLVDRKEFFIALIAIALQ